MALVAYAYSDSEDENADEDEENNDTVELNTGKVTLNENLAENNPDLFLCLPTPKSGSFTAMQEEDDEFLKKTATVTGNDADSDKKKRKSTVKITVPSLADYSSDEEDVPKKIFKPTLDSKSTGLFSVLPPPKAVKISTTNFVPNSVAKKAIQSKPIKSVHPEDDPTDQFNDTTEDDEKPSDLHFFSTIFTEKVDNKEKTTSSVLPRTDIDCARPVQDAVIKNNKYFSDMISNSSNIVNEVAEEEEIMENEEDLMKDAYTELVGRSRKAKGKKNKKQELDIIDIHATDIMPDPRDWMTKSLTEEQPMPAVKKGDEPSIQHRRKHQITYLAYQAKMNEQDLKNQWAMNRMSRKQTQAKYGF